MKKILFGIIILLLAGCSSDNLADFPGTGDNAAGEPVTFATYTGKSRTRANVGYFVDGVVNTTIPSQTRVGIFAWSQRNGSTWTSWTPDNNFNADFMYNQPAQAQTVQDGVAELSYSPTRYWPKDTTNKFAFFAYYPFVDTLRTETSNNDHGITLAAASDLNDKGIKKFHFKVQDYPRDQVDFLVSNYVINYNGTGKEAVTLALKHALSQVSINFQLDEGLERNGARINESTLRVSLKNAYGEGDLSIVPNATGVVSLNWATEGDRRDFMTNPSSISSSTDSRSSVLLMIPQKIADISLSVDYDINFYEVDADGNIVTDDRGNTHLLYSYKGNHNEVPLTNARDWEAGQRFIYNVAVNLQGISVTPKVEDWEEGGSTDENL